ncbi:PP2C family serine/threonine-protein phosphatase [Actinocorallia longicatena]|uniref:PP2C family serine/threonine-protein phosphatase n=2 Tax=Actinocorallia longicatena TaxID=111803 RepID=A0ABP6PUZ8_9ACTN
MDRALTGEWRVRGVSVRGYRHVRDGKPCQDAHGHSVTGPPDDRVTVLAVADGAGSRRLSDKGSALAVRLATGRFGRLCAGRSEERDVRGLLFEGLEDVRRSFLTETGAAAADHATTLTVVVLTRAWLGYLTVGDGFAVLRAGDEGGERQFHLLPQADAVSEYGNETVFLSSNDATAKARAECVRDPGVDGMFLSTDGLAQAALTRASGASQRPNSSFATGMLRSLDAARADLDEDDRKLTTYLSSDQLTRLNGDDKTVLRAVRL